MWRIRLPVGGAALLAGLAWVAVPSADAANGPTFRDCSLAGGLDPDFVQLSGVAVGPEGALTVPPGQPAVGIEASESSDPGDNLGHVTLEVTVTSRGVHAASVSGQGTGKVVLAAPLPKPRKAGQKYTIGWAATFDNGNHLCPSEFTPENTTPKPFVVTVE